MQVDQRWSRGRRPNINQAALFRTRCGAGGDECGPATTALPYLSCEISVLVINKAEASVAVTPCSTRRLIWRRRRRWQAHLSRICDVGALRAHVHFIVELHTKVLNDRDTILFLPTTMFRSNNDRFALYSDWRRRAENMTSVLAGFSSISCSLRTSG